MNCPACGYHPDTTKHEYGCELDPFYVKGVNAAARAMCHGCGSEDPCGMCANEADVVIGAAMKAMRGPDAGDELPLVQVREQVLSVMLEMTDVHGAVVYKLNVRQVDDGYGVFTPTGRLRLMPTGWQPSDAVAIQKGLPYGDAVRLAYEAMGETK